MAYKDPEKAAQAKREWARKNKAKVAAANNAARIKKREAVQNLKSAPCLDCGNVFPYVCMDFDHRPGEQKVADVSKLVQWNYGLAAMLDEIEKCDLVCANCHRIRTHNRANPDNPF